MRSSSLPIWHGLLAPTVSFLDTVGVVAPPAGLHSGASWRSRRPRSWICQCRRSWKTRSRSFPRSTSRSVLSNRSTMYQCLKFSNFSWMSRRFLRRGASRSVSSNTLVMYLCLRFVNILRKSSGTCPRSASRNVLLNRSSMYLRLRFWKRSSRRFRFPGAHLGSYC